MKKLKVVPAKNYENAFFGGNSFPFLYKANGSGSLSLSFVPEEQSPYGNVQSHRSRGHLRSE